MHIVGEDLAEDTEQTVLFKVLYFKRSLKKHCVGKILLGI